SVEEVLQWARRARRRRTPERDDAIVGPWSYEAKRGQGTIRLPPTEYRLLRFLCERPNHAFTTGRIAEAISTRTHRVTAETLRRHIAVLRQHLGFFSDYIQAVPYIGYRFKA